LPLAISYYILLAHLISLYSSISQMYLRSMKKLPILFLTPCSAELISTAYQPWNSVFLSQQINHSRLISQKNSLPNMA
jgi:hypothetical protein